MRELIRDISQNIPISPETLIEMFGSNKTMNKEDLVRLVAPKIQFSLQDTEKVVNSLVDTIIEVLSNGDKIIISGLGRLEVSKLKPRTIPHPKQPGRAIHLGHRFMPKLRPAPSLKDRINRSHGAYLPWK